MPYNELIKNFENIRAYLRDFYLYGFKTRTEYDRKSARTYDDIRRRIAAWLGDYVVYERNADGKIMSVSVNSRTEAVNPLFKAFKTKSFTDGDITLHFILFDILHSPEIKLETTAIIAALTDEYISRFDYERTFDYSTIRKKLNEYVEKGLLISEKRGNKTFYSRVPDTDISTFGYPLWFFSEVLPCGVTGSFLLDKRNSGIRDENPFIFKHHYITGTVDSEIHALLLDAMSKKCDVVIENCRKGTEAPKTETVAPLSLRVGTQNGRIHLLAHSRESGRLLSFRTDYIISVKLCRNPAPDFDSLREKFAQVEKHIWGVNGDWDLSKLYSVRFTVTFTDRERYFIPQRLIRERRCGFVAEIPEDANTAEFTAEVFDPGEMMPWIRTFICRIQSIECSMPGFCERLTGSLDKMYELYGIGGADCDI